MTDLHTHILHGMDDGAATLEESVQLLRMEIEQGVTTVALTPHFSFERSVLNTFLLRRQQAFEALQAAAGGIEDCPGLVLGAEVVFSPRILEEDMRLLCYGDGNAMLVELPVAFYPKWTADILFEMSMAGITPVLAHVERYEYLLNDPALLSKLVDAGAVAQVNAGSLLAGGRRRRAVLKLMKLGFVHIMASDAHSLVKRPPNLKEGMRMAAKKLGKLGALEMEECARGLVGIL